MSYYRHHIFFCLNQREGSEICCNQYGATGCHQYAKQRLTELGLSGPGKVRVNKSGCLDRCAEGPVLVVYPEDIWYRYIDEQDIEEIIQSHLIGGVPVTRLRI